MVARNTTKTDEVLHGVEAQVNERFFSFKKVLTASPLAITFAAEGLPDMKDPDYRVLVHDETQVGSVDESTIATTGFSILGGTGAEVAHIWIHGNVQE